MNTQCSGVLGRVFGHRYRPRYSTSEQPSGISFKNLYGDEQMHLACEVAKLSTQTYQCDVCERCGSIVARPVPSSEEQK